MFIPIPTLYAYYQKYPDIQTDSRRVRPHTIFWALDGERHKGSDFIEEALQKGACYCVSADQRFKTHPQVCMVPDSLRALQDLAAYHRGQFAPPCKVLAITGSNGKTTTKELCAQVLKARYNIHATQGNYNNHIGIPLTLLQAAANHDFVIIEMGANHLSEIKSYTEYTQPDYGLITNCSNAHIGSFGSEAHIQKAKGELFDYIKTKKSKEKGIFIDVRQPYLKNMSAGISRQIGYYLDTDAARAQKEWQRQKAHYKAFYSAYLIRRQPLEIGVYFDAALTPVRLHSTLTGDFNTINLLAAFSCGHYFGVPPALIARAIAAYEPQNHRSQRVLFKNNIYIMDAYNANPASMRCALESFCQYQEPGHHRKILILGEMKELGTFSQKSHQDLIHRIMPLFQEVFLCGAAFKDIAHPFHYFPDALAIKAFIEKEKIQKALFFVKGSRSNALERLIQEC